MKQKPDFENSNSNVISFHKFKENQSETVTSTIAAILAVKSFDENSYLAIQQCDKS